MIYILYNVNLNLGRNYMKKIIKHISKSFKYSKSPWNNLKNTSYEPNKDNKSIVLQDGELDIKYTKNSNIVIKEVLSRHVDNIKQELTYPLSQKDEEAFDFFINQDREEDQKQTKQFLAKQNNGLNQFTSRSYATLKYKENKLEKELLIESDISVLTSAGAKIVSGLYDQILLRASKFNNNVEVASHYTGMLKTDEAGNVVFERSKEGVERPKTEYNPNKGKFVSMESHGGNTASLEYIVYKTQSFAKKFELIFIPKDHKSISQIKKVCKALLSIKSTSTQDPEILDLVLKKHGLSNKEVAVELIQEIRKNDISNGIFHIDMTELEQKNPEIKKFILESNFLDENLSYNLKVSKETDSYNEPIITIYDQSYEEAIDYQVIGSSIDSSE
jgi:hypothetical protein